MLQRPCMTHQARTLPDTEITCYSISYALVCVLSEMRKESVSSQAYEFYLLIDQSIPVKDICITILSVIYF
jgi:hypothetical protein